MPHVSSAVYEEEHPGRAYDGRLLGRLVKRYVRPYVKLLIGALVCLPLAVTLELLQPYLMKVVVDDHLTTGKLEGLIPLCMLFFGTVAGLALVRFVQMYWVNMLGQRVTYRIREQLFARVQDLPQAYYDRTPVGRLLTRMTSDVEVVQEMFASGIVTVVGDFFLLIGIMGVMIWLNVKLAILTFLAIPVLLGITFWVRPRIRDAFRRVRAKLSEINSFFAEQLSGMAVVQLFRKEAESNQRFEGLADEYRQQAHYAILYDVSLYAVVESTGSIVIAGLIWYGGGGILEGALTFGVLVAFLSYIQKFFAPLMDLSSKYTIMQSAMAALERIFDLIDGPIDPMVETVAGNRTFAESSSSPLKTFLAEEEKLDNLSLTGIDSGPIISFENVCFSYDGEQPVLQKVSFRVDPGETVALVGATGSGKSTCLKLLCGLYDLKQGRITMGGKDIRDIPVGLLRSRMGMVMQDVFLFSGDIDRNIRLRDEFIDEEDIRKVVDEFGMWKIIRKFSGGFKSSVRERGSNLSAGERQLLSLARAVVRKPEILLVDEGTSNLDPSTEYEIQRVLNSVYGKTTTLVIAHRLSTVRRADRIVVLHKNEVREVGTHAELLAKKGIYARLYELQYRQQEVDPPHPGIP